MKNALVLLLSITFCVAAEQGTLLAEEQTLSRTVHATFRLELNSLTFNGSPPGGVGLVGDLPPIKPESSHHPGVVLHSDKSDSTMWIAVVSFPKGTRCDVEFSFLFKVEGLWQREVNSSGIRHVVILEPETESQSIVFVYDSTSSRVVARNGKWPTCDDYLLAMQLARAAKDEAAARKYEYASAVTLLQTGRVNEATAAYNRYVSTSSAGTDAREEYDRFHVLNAKILQNKGKSTDAITVLSAVPRTEGGDAYRAEIALALGGILDRTGDRPGARSVYFGLVWHSKLSQELKEQTLGKIALSYLSETAVDSVERGKEILRQLSMTSTRAGVKRWSLLALANMARKAENASEEQAALKAAGILGTTEQRLGVKVRILEQLFRGRDYEGVHRICNWILKEGQPGNQLPHLLYLDAVALRRLGRDKESRSTLDRLHSGFPGNAYAQYAASCLGAPVYSIPADTIVTGGTIR